LRYPSGFACPKFRFTLAPEEGSASSREAKARSAEREAQARFRFENEQFGFFCRANGVTPKALVDVDLVREAFVARLRNAQITGTYGHKWSENLRMRDLSVFPANSIVKGGPNTRRRRLAPEEVFWTG
jgi:hypothetical protein